MTPTTSRSQITSKSQDHRRNQDCFLVASLAVSPPTNQPARLAQNIVPEASAASGNSPTLLNWLRAAAMKRKTTIGWGITTPSHAVPLLLIKMAITAEHWTTKTTRTKNARGPSHFNRPRATAIAEVARKIDRRSNWNGFRGGLIIPSFWPPCGTKVKQRSVEEAKSVNHLGGGCKWSITIPMT